MSTTLQEQLKRYVLDNNFIKAQELINKGANVNKPCEFISDGKVYIKATLLYAAVRLNQTKQVIFLLKNKADVDENAPIFWAIFNANWEIFSLLMEKKPKLNNEQQEGLTPLSFILRLITLSNLSVLYPMFNTLLEKGANPNFGTIRPLSYAISLYPDKKFLYSLIETLLKHKADPNFTTDGKEPLFQACDQDAIGIAELLLKYGANPNKNNLIFTVIYDTNLDLLKLLVDHKAELNTFFIHENKYRYTPLTYAIHHINKDTKIKIKPIIEEILKHDVNVNEPNESGGALMSILSIADEYKNKSYDVSLEYLTDIFKLVLERKPKLNIQIKSASLLATAAQLSEAFVKLLLDHGADPNIVNEKDGSTALFVALRDYKMFKTLLNSDKINVNIQDSNGYSILHVLTKYGYSDLFKLCIEKGGDINLQNKKMDGETPLYSACLKGDTWRTEPNRLENARYILNHPSFNPNLLIKGKTFLQWADTEKFYDSAQDLIR